jgi:hypothetical protein
LEEKKIKTELKMLRWPDMKNICDERIKVKKNCILQAQPLIPSLASYKRGPNFKEHSEVI